MSDDPLLPFLKRKIETMPDLLSDLIIPVRPLEPDDEVLQTVEIDYRHTWQEVERARRYVKQLDALPREQAKASAIVQIHRHCFEAILSDVHVARTGPEATTEEIDIERRSMVELPNGVTIHWVPDANVMALPASTVRRQISWREELSAYQITESLEIGHLEILRPDLLMTRAAAPDPEPDRERKRF